MELFSNGALCLLLRLSVVPQNLPAHQFRDHTAIIKRQRNITIITKTVTIIIYVQTCSITYPNVYILLTILGTLPVSTATSERNFSTMRSLKTWLRSSIGNERMTGLALLSIHKDRQIDREKLMNHFVASSNRRSDLVLKHI